MAAMRRRSCRPRLFSDDASGAAARRSPTKAVGGACDKDSVQHFTLDEYDYPTPDTIYACPPPRRFSEYSSETLGVMAGQGVHGAFKERLLREIMRVDGCPYAESYAVLGEMNRKNEELMWLFQLPYRISIGATALIGLFAVPAVFHRDTALWFCTHFVKNETPPVETLDTMWKVGSWTWEWMEPAIGTASFCLLALQLIRSQMVKIDLKPYYGLVSSWRADRLTNAFPRATPNPEPISSISVHIASDILAISRPPPPPPHSSPWTAHAQSTSARSCATTRRATCGRGTPTRRAKASRRTRSSRRVGWAADGANPRGRVCGQAWRPHYQPRLCTRVRAQTPPPSAARAPGHRSPAPLPLPSLL